MGQFIAYVITIRQFIRTDVECDDSKTSSREKVSISKRRISCNFRFDNLKNKQLKIIIYMTILHDTL